MEVRYGLIPAILLAVAAESHSDAVLQNGPLKQLAPIGTRLSRNIVGITLLTMNGPSAPTTIGTEGTAV